MIDYLIFSAFVITFALGFFTSRAALQNQFWNHWHDAIKQHPESRLIEWEKFVGSQLIKWPKTKKSLKTSSRDSLQLTNNSKSLRYKTIQKYLRVQLHYILLGLLP